MKKTILLFAFILGGFTFGAHAQGTVPNRHFNDANLKAAKGNVTTELGLAGGINNTDFKLNEGASGLLRGRLFLKDDLALRLGLDLTVGQHTDNIYGTGVDAGKVGTVKETSSNLLLNLGIEHHYKGTTRLSPYVGGDLMIGFGSQNETLDNTNGTAFTPGTLVETKGPGSFSIGLRGVFGADYYIAEHLYLGAEAGLGFLYARDGKTTTTITSGSSTTTTTVNSAGDSWKINPSVITGLRIGFVF